MTIDATIWSRIFLLKGTYNILISAVFLLWMERFLPMLGAPAGNPAFPQLFLMLCLAFGVGYLLVGLDIDTNHGVAAIGVLGQASVFVILAWQWSKGNVSGMGLVPGLIDLAFALAFAYFLWSFDYDRRLKAAAAQAS